MEIFDIAIEINTHKTKIKEAINKFQMNIRVEMTKSSDMETFTEFLTTFNPNVDKVDVTLPNDITDEKLKEMLLCLSTLPKKVRFMFYVSTKI